MFYVVGSTFLHVRLLFQQNVRAKMLPSRQHNNTAVVAPSLLSSAICGSRSLCLSVSLAHIQSVSASKTQELSDYGEQHARILRF